MTGSRGVQNALLYCAIVPATVFLFQAIIVVIHEHIHSTTAFLLGHMPSPLAIVWGNPLTLDGWDEGVSYSALFSSGQGPVAAIIAVMPLVFHAIVVMCGMYLLLQPSLLKKKWEFHLIFWLVIVNLMELIAYMPMRAFAVNGDIGNINHGLAISPWVLFVPGTLLALAALYVLFVRVLPRANVAIAGNSLAVRYSILFFSAFFVFDWRSIFRVLLLPFPETGWLIGFAGISLSLLVIVICRPGTAWMMAAEKQVMVGSNG